MAIRRMFYHGVREVKQYVAFHASARVDSVLSTHHAKLSSRNGAHGTTRPAGTRRLKMDAFPAKPIVQKALQFKLTNAEACSVTLDASYYFDVRGRASESRADRSVARYDAGTALAGSLQALLDNAPPQDCFPPKQASRLVRGATQSRNPRYFLPCQNLT